MKQNEDLLQKEILHEYTKELNNIKDVLQINGNILSHSKEVIQLLKNSDKENLYKLSKPFLDSLNATFTNESRIHFHTKENISFLRVHKKQKYGENLKNIRPIVTKAITTQAITSGYEHGKYDGEQLTYRMVFPIFDEKEFLGVVEIGVDTRDIIQKIKTLVKENFNRDMQIIVIIKNDTPNFDRITNFNKKINGHFYQSDPKIDTIIQLAKSTTQDQTVELNKKIYYLKLTKIKLLDYNNSTIGNYFSIVDITEDVAQNQIFFYSSLAKPIIATILIVLLIGWLFSLFYKHFLILEKRTRSILDAQSALIVLSDGKNIIDCNRALLDFYGYNSLFEFKKFQKCFSKKIVFWATPPKKT